MALLHLAHVQAPGRVHAVTVDHGLRPASSAEAAAVAGFCAARGIPHAILTWAGPAPTGNLMDQARMARRRLIGGWAGGVGIGDVLLAHTADDVAETFLMNLARAAGVDGLAGLRPRWHDAGIVWHRPLLSVTRAALRDHLRGQGLCWAEDPTNDDPRRSRTRARRALAALGPLGITVEGLGRVAANLAAAAEALRRATADFALDHAAEVAGSVRCDRAALSDAAPEVRRRFLRAVLQAQTMAAYPPREAQLAALADRLAQGRDATLAGVRFRHGPGIITASRELRAVAGLTAQPGAPWDGRWRLTGPGEGEVRALGAGLRRVPDWRATGLSRAVLEVTPGVWQGDRLVAAPAAGWSQGWTAEFALRLHAIIKAH